MPFELDLPEALRKQGWKVKIREGERLEDPHVTIIRRLRTWRYDLRTPRFLDRDPPARDVPVAVVACVDLRVDELRRAWDELRRAWDAKYPENPVRGAR